MVAAFAVVVLALSLAAAPSSDAGPAAAVQATSGQATAVQAIPGQATSGQAGGPIRGYIDAHSHIAASEAFGGALRCGEPFAPGGMAEALADCPSHSGTGHFALLESVLGGTALPGGTQGFPTFEQWPSHDSQLHEQAHYPGIERA